MTFNTKQECCLKKLIKVRVQFKNDDRFRKWKELKYEEE